VERECEACGRPSAMLAGAVGFLLQQEMKQQAVSLVCGMKGGQHATLALVTISPLEGRGDRWTVMG